MKEGKAIPRSSEWERRPIEDPIELSSCSLSEEGKDYDDPDPY